MTYPFNPFLQLVVNKKWEILGRLLIQVQEKFKVWSYHMLEDFVTAEGIDEKVIESIFQVQQILKRENKTYLVIGSHGIYPARFCNPICMCKYEKLRTWTKEIALVLSSSRTKPFPCSRRYRLIHSETVLRPSWTRLKSLYMQPKSSVFWYFSIW
jgi:hypothetical protein